MLKVKIRFTGRPGSGKTILMQIARNAFRAQGSCGITEHLEEYLEHSMTVTFNSMEEFLQPKKDIMGHPISKKQIYADKKQIQIKSRYNAGREYAKQECAYLAGMAVEPEVPEGCLGNGDFQVGYDGYLKNSL